MNHELDETDRLILQYLLENSSRSHKEIGRLVHLTGQAVGARIRKLEEAGVVEGYTLHWNPEKIGLVIHAFVTVFLKSSAVHTTFQDFSRNARQIEELHRVSGEGCYWMRARFSSQGELNELLDELLQYGNYKVSLSLGRVK